MPTFGLVVLFWKAPSILVGVEELTHEIYWMVGSGAATYLSLVFSLYAALQVQKIQNKQYSDKVLPVVKRDIDGCFTKLDDLLNDTVEELILSGVLNEATSAFNSLSLARVARLSKPIREARRRLRRVTLNLKRSKDRKLMAREVEGYWEFYQALGMVRDEVGGHLKTEKARS